MMTTYDVAIAGGGPIGCTVARHLASQGIHGAVFEEHHTFGVPVHCAGLVTQRAINISRCPRTGVIQNTIYGAYIHSPSGTLLTIGGKKAHGIVINRQQFDAALAHDADQKGAELNLEYKIVSAERQQNHIVLTTQHHGITSTTSCAILVGADGPHSLIRRIFKFPHPKETLQGIGAKISDTDLDPKYVHILVGHHIAPGFFAWIIPTNQQGTKARIGLCTKRQTTRHLNDYLDVLLQHPLLKGVAVEQKFGGAIPLGPLKTTVIDNVMLVGDAAAQVKPTSGGGIYPGLVCATHCAAVAEKALRESRTDDRFLQHYHAQWTKEIGRELSLGMQFRRLFASLTDAQFDKYLEKLRNPKTLDVINTYGDIDYPSRLAFPLLRTSPSLLSLFPSLLKRRRS